MIQTYLNKIFQMFKSGDASERSYYPILVELLENISSDIEDYLITIEAKNSSVRIPDFKIKDSKDLLIGYIEAKDVGRDLDKLSQGENDQIKKYIKEYDKLILTNFIEFRFYEDQELIETVLISQPITLKLGQPALDNEPQFRALVERFLYSPAQEIHNAKRLSEILAQKTQSLRNLILEEINLEDQIETSTEELLKTFQKMLDPEMKAEEFADMYAQTITFGLFVARINSKNEQFDRLNAYKFALENPANGDPIKISKMGVVSINPEEMKLVGGKVIFTTMPTWHPIEEDMDSFYQLIQEISSVLNGELPPASETCSLCVYRSNF